MFYDGRIFRFFDKLPNLECFVNLHDAEVRREVFREGFCGNGDVSLCRDMLANKVLEVHAVELVAGKNDNNGIVFDGDVGEVLANGVGSSLVPVVTMFGLFCGQNVDKAAAEIVEFVGFLDMAMQGSGIKLREQVDVF